MTRLTRAGTEAHSLEENMPNEKYTAEFDDPVEIAPGQWRYTYRILNSHGLPVAGMTRTDEACCSAEDASEQAAIQAEVDIDTLEGRDRAERRK
ncbi:MAG: hypothetical protein ACTS5Y_11920 [Pollutimonas bauzanensis]